MKYRILLTALAALQCGAVQANVERVANADSGMKAASQAISEPVRNATLQSDIRELKAQLALLQKERVMLAGYRDSVRRDLHRTRAQLAALPAEASPAPPLQAGVAPPPSLALKIVKPIADAVVATTQSAEAMTLPVPSRLSVQNLIAQEIIQHSVTGADGATQTHAQAQGQPQGNGFWYLLALVPFGFAATYVWMRSSNVKEEKQSESIKDENLYELVFGSQRDRSQIETPEQVSRALGQIRHKASQYQPGTDKSVLVEHSF